VQGEEGGERGGGREKTRRKGKDEKEYDRNKSETNKHSKEITHTRQNKPLCLPKNSA
jgi:hypothetical protein